MQPLRRATVALLSCFAIGACADPVHVASLAFGNGTTYLIARDGRVFMLGEATLWADRAKGVKACPVLYSLCTDVPLALEVNTPIKAIASTSGLTALLTQDGGLVLHGFNDQGRAGLDYSADVRVSELRFSAATIPMPEPAESLAASTRAIFIVGRTGTLRFLTLRELRSGDPPIAPLHAPAGLPSVQRVVTDVRRAIARDRDGELWEIVDTPTLARRVTAPGQGDEIVDFMLASGMLYVLRSKGRIECLQRPDNSEDERARWRKRPCPGRTSLPALTGQRLRLTEILPGQIAVRDEAKGVTYVPDIKATRYPLPWLEADEEGRVRSLIHSWGQRHVFTSGGDIFVAGDNVTLQSGLASGNTVVAPHRLEGFRWQP